MIRTEDIIKHSGIIKYLKYRRQRYNKEFQNMKKNGIAVGYEAMSITAIIKELDHVIKHFEGKIK